MLVFVLDRVRHLIVVVVVAVVVVVSVVAGILMLLLLLLLVLFFVTNNVILSLVVVVAVVVGVIVVLVLAVRFLYSGRCCYYVRAAAPKRTQTQSKSIYNLRKALSESTWFGPKYVDFLLCRHDPIEKLVNAKRSQRLGESTW